MMPLLVLILGLFYLWRPSLFFEGPFRRLARFWVKTKILPEGAFRAIWFLFLVLFGLGFYFGWGIASFVFAGTLFVFLVFSVRQNIRRKQCETESLSSFLRTIQGLLRTGIGLPPAMRQASEILEPHLKKSLSLSLNRFDEGKNIADCLTRFREKKLKPPWDLIFALLEMAYRRGLPLLPLLNGMLPWVEAERLQKEKVRSLRNQILGQGLVASVIPWVVLLFMEMNGVGGSAFHSWEGKTGIGGALLWEGLGFWTLFRLSRFGQSKKERRERDLFRFFQSVSLYLSVGYDLAYAWTQASPETAEFAWPQTASLSDHLKDLALREPDPKIRVWLRVIAELYLSGSPLLDVFQAFLQGLNQHRELALQAFSQRLPLRLNLCLLGFFFPPQMALLMAPLLAEFLNLL